MVELALYVEFIEKVALYSTIFGCLRTKIIDINTGHKNRFYIVIPRP